jgi:hypothetical protein
MTGQIYLDKRQREIYARKGLVLPHSRARDLVQNGFEVVQGYNWDQDRAELKPITRSNWRILVVSRKNSN